MSGGNFNGAILSLVGMAIYAAHDVIIKMLGAGYPPHQVLFFTSLMSMPFMTVLLLRNRRPTSLWPRQPGWVGLRSACITIATLCNFYAFAVLPLAQVYLLLFTMPLLVTVLAIPLLGERVGIHRWMAVLVGLAGVLIVLNPGVAPLGPGHLAAMTGAVLTAMASVIIRRLGSTERAETMLMWPLIGNLVLSGAMMAFDYRPMALLDLTLTGVIALFGLIASFLVILSYRMGEAAVVAPMQYSQILWAGFYGWLIFDERLDMRTVLGMTIIIASGLYILLRERTPGQSRNRPASTARLRPDTGAAPKSTLLGRLLRNGE